MDHSQYWPEPGTVVTFDQYDFSRGRARFINIGVVAGEPEPHPHLDLTRIPIIALPGAEGPVPDWITQSDIIEVVPRGWSEP